MLDIKGSVAVITGAASGIGEAMARYWVRNGGRVVLADVSETALEKVVVRLEASGDAVAKMVCNVTREEDNSKLAALAVERFGGINLVFPSAGIISDGLMLSIDRQTGKVNGKMSLDQFRSVVDVNLTGVFLTVRECAEKMVDTGSFGLICLISSIGSLGTAGQLNYSSTKAALSVMPRVVTAEFFRRGLAGRIRCVAVAPGYVGTEMVRGMNQKALDRITGEIPIGRLVEPAEVASLVGELYRNEALAGDVFFIHGGLRLGSRG
ncbi:MAG TPA: SDR family oxidoreductase [Desulfobacteraceae bacterium]|nr:SDR family oxidoreductase [Desulfobacteraceae bacterium]